MADLLSRSEAIVLQLDPLFKKAVTGEPVERSDEQTELCKTFFSQNVLVLHTCLGFVIKDAPCDQLGFAGLICVSKPGLRRWEAG